MSIFKRSLKALLLACSSAALVPTAQAITPESGFWYNVNEPGTGISIEITDDFLYLAAYGFDAAGFPFWYTSGGFMSNDRTYSGGLAEFRNGQAFGAAWLREGDYLGNTGGQVNINFNPNDETRATISWFGRTYQIERTDTFRLIHGTANNIHQSQRMLGEWTMVFDLYNRPGDTYRAYPFFGDVVIFDVVDQTTNPDYYDGCRPTSSLTGECTTEALNKHDASGYYNAPTGEQIFVVADAYVTNPANDTFFNYFVKAGLTQFDGVMSITTRGQNAANGPFYPVRGFRSASANYVITGVGPNAVEDDSKAASTPAISLADSLKQMNGGNLPSGLTAAEVQKRFGMDMSKLAPLTKPIQDRMQVKRAQR